MNTHLAHFKIWLRPESYCIILYLYEFLLDLLIAIQQNSPTKTPYIWPNLLNIANDDDDAWGCVYVVVQFYPDLNFISFCFKLIIILYHSPKTRKTKFKTRIKLNYNIFFVLHIIPRTHNLLDNATTVMAAHADLETD